MKKSTLLLAMLAAVPALGQQVIMKDADVYKDNLVVIPKQFTVNNVPILHIEQGKIYGDDEYTIVLYNDDIEKIAEVNPINHTFNYTLTYQTQTREVKEVMKEELYREYYRELNEWYTFEQFIRDYSGGEADVKEENGDTIIIREFYEYNYFGYNYFGTKYPIEYFLCKDNVIYRVRAQYYATYTDWTTTGERKEENSCNLNVFSIYYRDLDVKTEGDYFTLSQTLFNTDEKFEYIIPKMVLTDISDYVNMVPGDGGQQLVLSRSELISDYAYPTIKGLQVVSSDGTVLYDLDFVDGFYRSYDIYTQVYGITIGGKDYLVIDGYMEGDEEDEECALFYRINRQTNSLQEVKSLPVKMRVKQQESTINVQLSNTTEPSEVIMTNSLGQVIGKKYVPAGESTTTFKTSMPKGVYNITRFQNGKNIEDGKILMK